METLVRKPYQIPMRAYEGEVVEDDRVGEDGFLVRARREFGNLIYRGTACCYQDKGRYHDVEQLFRQQIPKDVGKVLEVGTFRGG